MARSFDKGDKQRDEEENGYSHPVGASALPPLPPPVVNNTLQQSPPPQPPPLQVIDEVAQEGRHLYMDFIRTQIRNEGLTDICIDNTDSTVSVEPLKVLEWVRAGRELRQLADAFSRSKERESVRKKACKVSVETLDSDHFLHLLQELFQGGRITRERVVVLFFFCADVAMQALRLGLHTTFHRLVDWSLRYIATQVAAWVHSCGGWGVVLRSGLDVAYQISAVCAFVAVFAACTIYIRRNL